MNTLFTGLNCIELQSIDSTNNYAASLLKQTNVPEGTVILAHEQTRGRGQRNAVWHSEPHKNLTFSVIYKPVFLSLSEQFILSKLTAISLLKLLTAYTNQVKIKWPNDILVNNKKIAGVLIDNIVSGSTINYTIIGVGINVNQSLFNAGLNATSLFLENNVLYDIKVVLEQFCSILELYYIKLRNNHTKEIEEIYLQHLLGLNRWLRFIYEGRMIEAMITGVCSAGKLKLLTRDMQHLKVDVKEIKFII
jgi:BirA family biotin operon repressor/biotin-[acetyl-CoA-carboxylase] ligase